MQKLVRRDKDGHYTLIKGTMQQEDRTILNTYALNNYAIMFIKTKLLSLNKQIGPDKIVVGFLNILHS
jgi:hypothetical protein